MDKNLKWIPWFLLVVIFAIWAKWFTRIDSDTPNTGPIAEANSPTNIPSDSKTTSAQQPKPAAPPTDDATQTQAVDDSNNPVGSDDVPEEGGDHEIDDDAPE